MGRDVAPVMGSSRRTRGQEHHTQGGGSTQRWAQPGVSVCTVAGQGPGLLMPPCLSQLLPALGLGALLCLAHSLGLESAVRNWPRSAVLAFEFTKGCRQETYARCEWEIIAKNHHFSGCNQLDFTELSNSAKRHKLRK